MKNGRDTFFGFFIPKVGEAHLFGAGVTVLLLLGLCPEAQETVWAHLSRDPRMWLCAGFIVVTALMAIYFGFSSDIPHPVAASFMVFGSSMFAGIVGIFSVDAYLNPSWPKLIFEGTVEVKGDWRWYELIVPGLNFAQSIMTLILLRLARTRDLQGRFIPGDVPVWQAAICCVVAVGAFAVGKVKGANPWITASYALAASFGVADVLSRFRGKWRC